MSQLATSKLSVSSICVPAMPETSNVSNWSMSTPALRNASTFLWKLLKMRSVIRTTTGPMRKARRKSSASWKRMSDAGIRKARCVEPPQQFHARERLHQGRSDSAQSASWVSWRSREFAAMEIPDKGTSCLACAALTSLVMPGPLRERRPGWTGETPVAPPSAFIYF